MRIAHSILLCTALVALATTGHAADERGTPSLETRDCVCSPGVDLAGPGEPPSVLRNCRCESLQCVVHVGSGQLQCTRSQSASDWRIPADQIRR